MPRTKKVKPIRVLVVPPGKPPEVAEVDPRSWRTWYPLVDKTTHLFEMLKLETHLDMLFDEEGALKEMPLNLRLAAQAPSGRLGNLVRIDMTGGKGMKPGEPGLGFHQIRGTFLIARSRGSEYVDLLDADIERCRAWLGRE